MIPVVTNELLGLWRYDGDYHKTTIDIEFFADGTFTQRVMLASGLTRIQSGSWTLDDSSVELTDVLMNDGLGWTPDTNGWWFVDHRDRFGRRELYGGESRDPDGCWPLTFLRPPVTSASAGFAGSVTNTRTKVNDNE